MTFLSLLRISRPRFWVYLAGPYLLGYLFADQSLFAIPFIDALTFIYFFLFGNVYLYGINDYFDRDTDALNPKKGTKEHLLQNNELQQLRFALILLFLFSLFLIYLQPNLLSAVLFGIYLFLASFYSAPPLRFKAKPFIDSASNILYAFPAFIAFSAATGSLPSVEVMVLAGCWTASMHLFSAIPDIEADKKAHLTTTAVLLGRIPALLLCSVLWGVFALLILLSSWVYPYSFIALLYPLIPLLILFFSWQEERIYWFFPYLNTVLGFIAFLSFVL